MRSLIICLLFLLFIASCATKAGTGTAVGAGGGAVVGGLIGGETGALIGGAIGGLGGYAVGRSMDIEDQRRAAEALEYNRAVEWRGDQGEVYRMQPTQTSYRDGRECRSYRLYADVEGQADTITGVACRRPDGSWQSMEG